MTHRPKTSKHGWFIFGLACFGTLFGPGSLFAGPTVSPPLEVYGHLPSLEEMVISPSGTKLAYVQTIADQRNLFVYTIGESQSHGAAHVGDAKLRAVEWLDDENLMLTVSSTQLPPFGFTGALREWFQLLTYNVPKHELRPLNLNVQGERTFNVVSGRPVVRELSGKTTVFIPGLYVADRTLPALFRYEVATKRVNLIRKSGQPFTNWLVDDEGFVAAELIYHDQDKTWNLLTRKEDHLIPVATGIAPIDVPSVIGFGAQGDSILMQFVEDGNPVYKPLLMKDASWGAPLARGQVFLRFLEDRKSGRIIGGIPDLDDSHLIFFDNELQAHWNAVLRAFPNERVRLISHSDDYSKAVVEVFGAQHGYAYELFDWYSHSAESLGNVYNGVTSPAPVRPISYQAADSTQIPGYLTLPNDRQAHKLPLVVLPHGGPAVADTLRFDWWAQALAAQGYAVLQPNYRGSALDRRFMEAGFHEWGRKMQTDLSDGVRHLAQQGVVDDKRVCIVGASYGGYAALAGMTLDSGVYRCAVSVAGVSDLKRFLKWTDYRAGHGDSQSQRYWDRFMGASNPSDPSLAAISPIEHVNAVAGPILLIHGRDDTVVPYEQTAVMADALKHAGKTYELLTLSHEDHWLSRTATRAQMLEATVAFLKINNPPD